MICDKNLGRELKQLSENLTKIDDLTNSLRECIEAQDDKITYLEMNSLKEKEESENLKQ